MVHNARYALLVERALATFWKQRGHTFREGRPITPDAFNVVKEFSISYCAPIRGTDDVLVHFWLKHIGSSSAVDDFRLLSPNEPTIYAEGRRVIKLDRTTLRPSRCTPVARAVAKLSSAGPVLRKAGSRHPGRMTQDAQGAADGPVRRRSGHGAVQVG
ncbi:hotdog domain-containing protein [Kribbella sp. NPDC050820]|uniref:acyl-CoA thioesterase n=1 Tax=Kribbella sp. NPDC050820 TaxID=3155408 RepID=UPI0033FAE9B2